MKIDDRITFTAELGADPAEPEGFSIKAMNQEGQEILKNAVASGPQREAR